MKINNQIKARQLWFNRGSLAGLLLLIHALTFAGIPDIQTFEAEKAKLLGGASTVTDKSASGGQLVNLTKFGQGLKFENLTKTDKLAIRYASVNVGTISVRVNNQPAVKVNVHSSGAISGSFLYAIIDLFIPKGAQLNIAIDTSDVAVAIDKIIEQL